MKGRLVILRRQIDQGWLVIFVPGVSYIVRTEEEAKIMESIEQLEKAVLSAQQYDAVLQGRLEAVIEILEKYQIEPPLDVHGLVRNLYALPKPKE